MAKKGTLLAWLLLKPVIFLLLPFFIILNMLPGPNGQPMLTWAEDTKAWLAQLQTPKISQTPHPFSTREPQAVELYRWQDDKGLWHFSQQKPQDQGHVQTIQVSTQLSNIMPKPKDTKMPSTSQTQEGEAITPLNVLQKAKDLHKTAEKRNQVLDSL